MKRNANSRHPQAREDVATEAEPTLVVVDPRVAARDPIDLLVDDVGESSREEIDVLTAGATEHELVDAGRKVATDRITDDTLRVGTIAWKFLTTAAPDLTAKVKITPQVVRALIWGAAQGNRAWRRLKAEREAQRSRRDSMATRHALPQDRARSDRDQLAESLRGVAAGDSTETRRIAAALAPGAGQHVEVGPGQSLSSLVAIGREFIASADAGRRTRCERFALTRAWLDDCQRRADEALAAERSESAPAVSDYETQRVVDRWDGVNLMLIERVVRAFAEGHKLEPGVPKLNVVSLRGVVGAHPRGRKKPVTPA